MPQYYEDGLTVDQVNQAIDEYLLSITRNSQAPDEVEGARIRALDHIRQFEGVEDDGRVMIHFLPPWVRPFAPILRHRPIERPQYSSTTKRQIESMEAELRAMAFSPSNFMNRHRQELLEQNIAAIKKADLRIG